METINNTPGNQVNETFSLNIAIVGGGRNVLLTGGSSMMPVSSSTRSIHGILAIILKLSG